MLCLLLLYMCTFTMSHSSSLSCLLHFPYAKLIAHHLPLRSCVFEYLCRQSGVWSMSLVINDASIALALLLLSFHFPHRSLERGLIVFTTQWKGGLCCQAEATLSDRESDRQIHTGVKSQCQIQVWTYCLHTLSVRTKCVTVVNVLEICGSDVSFIAVAFLI